MALGIRIAFSMVIMMILLNGGAFARSSGNRPWEDPSVPIIIDPYAENDINWDKAVTDKRLMAVIHKASEGDETDPKFVERAAEAKKRGLLWGAYHLGRPGDPIKQAKKFLDLANATGAKFLAIDIEADDPSKFMSLQDAAKFIEYVHSETRRYPAIYVNYSVYESISKKYDASSVFAKAPLWVARFKPELGMDNHKLWSNYTLWQFSSEINCASSKTCFYRVPGTATDMDVNVFLGDANALRALFE